jgi:hypothetical protein
MEEREAQIRLQLRQSEALERIAVALEKRNVFTLFGDSPRNLELLKEQGALKRRIEELERELEAGKQPVYTTDNARLDWWSKEEGKDLRELIDNAMPGAIVTEEEIARAVRHLSRAATMIKAERENTT